MTTAATVERTGRLLTIGAVCRRLQSEFADISISKIRYLEDQGLVSPKRTQGGYRLFAEEDVERLRTILRLQRDEFLPLRVIRQELASLGGQRARKRRTELGEDEDALTLAELCERTGITVDDARALEEFGLLEAQTSDGEKRYAESDVDVALACARLAGYGVSPRHLRGFRTAADRHAALLEQLVAPALRSRNSERRQGALDDLQTLAELAQELSHLLFWRAVRRIAVR